MKITSDCHVCGDLEWTLPPEYDDAVSEDLRQRITPEAEKSVHAMTHAIAMLMCTPMESDRLQLIMVLEHTTQKLAQICNNIGQKYRTDAN